MITGTLFICIHIIYGLLKLVRVMNREQCRQIISSDSYVDILVRYKDDVDEILARYPDVCSQIVNENWIVVYANVNEIQPINYYSYGYYPIPKLYGLMDNTNMVESGIIRVHNQPTLELTGEGVIIGFVDTGIDYLHEAFIDEYGKTRILSIWDQNDSDGNMPEGINYGSEYSRTMINEALSSDDPYSIVPEKDEPGGHGTFMAGIAAGSRKGSDFVGAAPDSDIVMVKLRQAKPELRKFYLVNDDARAYSETDIMIGIRYLLQVAARENKPIVICLGVGTSYGPHTMGTPLTQMISLTADLVTTTVVVPVGNEGNARHHFRGIVDSTDEYTIAELRVGTGEKGFMLELWGRLPDIFSIGIVAPTGEIVNRIPSRNLVSRREEFIFNNTIIDIDYKLVETISASQIISMRFIDPSPGIWQIRVYTDNSISGEFNMWLPISEFLTSDTYFVQSDPFTTITQPATASAPISVAAYNHRDDSLWMDSGRGYTADGIIKPDISAPGVDIYGPRSGSVDGYTIKSGTSVASAHVAGAAALIFQWRVRRDTEAIVNTLDIKTLLIIGARRNPRVVYPNRDTGYGYLDIYGVYESLAQ